MVLYYNMIIVYYMFVGWLVVVAHGLYPARHLYILYLNSHCPDFFAVVVKISICQPFNFYEVSVFVWTEILWNCILTWFTSDMTDGVKEVAPPCVQLCEMCASANASASAFCVECCVRVHHILQFWQLVPRCLCWLQSVQGKLSPPSSKTHPLIVAKLSCYPSEPRLSFYPVLLNDMAWNNDVIMIIIVLKTEFCFSISVEGKPVNQ